VWADLGNHNAGLANAAQMGAATVCRHADGRLCLFVKNGGGGLSAKSQTSAGGGWGGWVDLGGTDVQDGISAVRGPDGRLEVFAATRATILHWYQTAPNGPFTFNPNLPAMVPASPPTAILDQAGRIRVVCRRDGGTDIAVAAQTVPGGSWGQPLSASGPGGHGQVAAVLDAGLVRLYCRDADGAVSTALLDTTGLPGSWAGLGGTTDVPAVMLDQAGQPLLAIATGDRVSLADPAGGWQTLQP
jgi:hypothetical protein